MSVPAASKRLSVLFEGRVQGVGFRYTTVSIAARFQVTGFVKNLPDGDVELVAEGTEPEIEAFLQALRASHVHRYVFKERVNWSEPVGQFQGFTVES